MKNIFTESKYIESADKCLDFIKRMLDPAEWEVLPYYSQVYPDDYQGELMWGGATDIPDDAERVDPVYIQPAKYYEPGYTGVIEGTYKLPKGANPSDYAVAVYEVATERSLICYCPLLTREVETADGVVKENYWCTGDLVEAWEYYQSSYDRNEPLMLTDSGSYVPWSPDPETGVEPTKWYQTKFTTTKVVYWYWAKRSTRGGNRAYEIELVRKKWPMSVTEDVLNKYLSKPAPRPAESYTRTNYVGMEVGSYYNIFELLNRDTIKEHHSGWIGKNDKVVSTPDLPEFTTGNPEELVTQSFQIDATGKKHKGFIEYGYSYFKDYKVQLYTLVLGDAEYLNGEAMLWSDVVCPIPDVTPDIPEITVEIVDVIVMLGSSHRKKNYTFLASVDTPDADLFIPGYATVTAENKGAITQKDSYITYKVEYDNPSNAFQYQLRADTTKTPLYELPARTEDRSFRFIACGDPQITNATSASAWSDTLSLAFSTYSEAQFIATLGDLVDAQTSMSLAEQQFSYFAAPKEIRTHPHVIAMGNHDDNMGLGGHLFPPNESTYGVVGGMGDYYLKFEDSLIIVLNTNVKDDRVTEHIEFMNAIIPEFINDYGRPKWIIVMFHHSIFQPTGTAEEEQYVILRNYLAPTFSKYRVDLVLMGHVHAYCRTPVIDCSELSAGDAVTQDCVVHGSSGNVFTKTSHGQTVYVTLNSASGSKYYPLSGDYWYNAKTDQQVIPNYSYVEVTSEHIKIVTHKTDDNAVIDEFTLYK